MSFTSFPPAARRPLGYPASGGAASWRAERMSKANMHSASMHIGSAGHGQSIMSSLAAKDPACLLAKLARTCRITNNHAFVTTHMDPLQLHRCKQMVHVATCTCCRIPNDCTHALTFQHVAPEPRKEKITHRRAPNFMGFAAT